MRRSIIDYPGTGRRGARLPRYAALERRPHGRLTPLFETVFRRARSPKAHLRLARYLAVERRR